MSEQLTPAELEVLEFARATWKYQGARAGVIRERFGTSVTRYVQRLHAVLAKPAAVAYDAQLVARLTREQARRTTARTAGFEAVR